MPHRSDFRGIAVLLLTVLTGVARGGELPKVVPVVPAARANAKVQSLARLIDEALAKKWAAEGVEPASLCTDAEFCRRVWLDIGGKIPPVAEVHAFLADNRADKRERLVEQLLDSPSYVTHFTTVWRTALLPEVDADLQARALVPAFEAWLRQKLTDDASHADIVRDVLTTSLNGQATGGAFQPGKQLRPTAFYQVKQLKPENLAAGTARVFLGVRIECAQCHDHPFDTWKREQFWSYAAFFAGIERQEPDNVLSQIRELFDKQTLQIPGTSTTVSAAWLDGTKPESFRPGPRVVLADWMLSPKNPYVGRAAVNRLWAQFFGLGIVHPVDDFSSQNPPSHPELLDELARQFIESGYSAKFLIRALTSSRAYQLSAATPGGTSPPDVRLFARMPVKGLTSEQIFDSLAQATGFYRPFNGREALEFGNTTPRDEFLEMFANTSDTPTERTTTILQALAMMNGQFVGEATGLEKSATLAAIADFPAMTTAERLEALYFASVSRPPRPEELARLVAYVDEGGPTKDPRVALSDVFWALLNSSEFLFNH